MSDNGVSRGGTATVSLTILALTLPTGCGGKGVPLPHVQLPAARLLINPVINDEHLGGIPDTLGDRGAGVAIELTDGRRIITNSARTAAVQSLVVGTTELTLDGRPAPSFHISNEHELIDLALAFDGTDASIFRFFPQRYCFDGDVVVVGPRDDPERVVEAAQRESTTIVLEPGTRIDTTVWLARGVTLVGPGVAAEDAWIASVQSMAEQTTVRGIALGDLHVGTEITFAFNLVLGPSNISGASRVRMWGNTFCGPVEFSAIRDEEIVLLANRGIPPMPAPDEICERP